MAVDVGTKAPYALAAGGGDLPRPGAELHGGLLRQHLPVAAGGAGRDLVPRGHGGRGRRVGVPSRIMKAVSRRSSGISRTEETVVSARAEASPAES